MTRASVVVAVGMTIIAVGLALGLGRANSRIDELNARLDAGVPPEPVVVLTDAEQGLCEYSDAFAKAVRVAERIERDRREAEAQLSACRRNLTARVPTCDEVCPGKFEQGRYVGHLDYSEALDCYRLDCPRSDPKCPPVVIDKDEVKLVERLEAPAGRRKP